MTDGSAFSELLLASVNAWSERKSDACVLSLALPVYSVDPLKKLSDIADKQQFRFLWDLSPGLCISAAGHCQHLNLSGSKRFANAQRFSDETFDQLVDVSRSSPEHALPRILFAFSFFDQPKNPAKDSEDSFALQAVLPRWQLSSQNGNTWLRLNEIIHQLSDIRKMVEDLWTMRKKIIQESNNFSLITRQSFSVNSISKAWEAPYREALSQGIALVNSGELDKLVLAARQLILLEEPLDPLGMLFRLRHQQTNSCRFLWQHSSDESFFGASPERLISLHQSDLKIDALAGTAKENDDGHDLMNSPKDLREHKFVVNSIIKQLNTLGIDAIHLQKPQIFRQGHLIHLRTLVSANSLGVLPLNLVDALHPTPAVAGLPFEKAIGWLRALEPFDRGGYAAPIGWIDSRKNSDFRVAIRCGYISGKNLELMAGAGLVKGSTVQGEFQEVAMKLNVLTDQLDLEHKDHSRYSSRR